MIEKINYSRNPDYIKVYHGTCFEFDEIRLDKCLPKKDFGKAFYVTKFWGQAKEQALRSYKFTVGFDWSERKKHLVGLDEHFKSLRPIVKVFYINTSELYTLKGKTYSECSQDWLHIIVSCRQNRPHSYDYLEGPVADGNTNLDIKLWKKHEIDDNELFSRLSKFHRIKKTHQISANTEQAINHLNFHTDSNV